MGCVPLGVSLGRLVMLSDTRGQDTRATEPATPLHEVWHGDLDMRTHRDSSGVQVEGMFPDRLLCSHVDPGDESQHRGGLGR